MNTQSFQKPESPRHWTRSWQFGVSAAIIALAIIGLTWYAYPRFKQRFKQQTSGIAELASLRNVVNTLGDRMKVSDSTIKGWIDSQEQLRGQLTKTEQQLTVRIAKAGKSARDSSDGLYRRVQAQMENRIQGIQTRVAQLESAKPAEDPRVAELQREVGRLRERLGREERDLQAAMREFRLDATAQDRQFATLEKGEERNRQSIVSAADSLAVRRVDFEVSRNRTTELAPGISLHIRKTSQAFSNVDGWMRVMPEDRTFWLHRQNAQEPVIFYGRKDGRKRELVITNVRPNAVTGYLLLPAAEQAPKQVAATQVNSAPAP